MHENKSASFMSKMGIKSKAILKTNNFPNTNPQPRGTI